MNSTGWQRGLKKYEEINIEKLITEKKKSEAIVGTISDPIIVVDKGEKDRPHEPACRGFVRRNRRSSNGKNV